MIRMYNKDEDYIRELLTEMEKDANYCYEINVDEYRQNGLIQNITINTRKLDEVCF